MVARRVKIYKGETSIQELQQAFKDEMKGILKDAALKMKCSVEELKCRFDNLGRVEVQRMTPEEMVVSESERLKHKRARTIRRIRNG